MSVLLVLFFAYLFILFSIKVVSEVHDRQRHSRQYR